MKERDLTELSDQELLQEVKKMKSNSAINAFLIGFVIAIIFYSIAKKSVGIFTIIPLFLVYKLLNNDPNKKLVDAELKSRNLK